MQPSKDIASISKFINNILISFEVDLGLKKGLFLPPYINGYLIKQPIHASKSDYSFSFIDKTTTNSICCFFKENNDSLSPYPPSLSKIKHSTLYQIKIEKYSFDFLLVERNQKILDFNVILVIYKHVIEGKKEDQMFYNKISPINVNKEEVIIENSKNAFTTMIKRINSEYQNIFQNLQNNQMNATNFISKTFAPSVFVNNTISFFDICKKLYHFNSTGFLVKEKEPVDYPWLYMITEDDSKKAFEQMNWKELLMNMPSIKKKQEYSDIDPLRPSDVKVDNINNDKNLLMTFLMKKFKRRMNTLRDMKEDELNKQNVQTILNYYGRNNSKIGHSLIEKYSLYKKYIQSDK